MTEAISMEQMYTEIKKIESEMVTKKDINMLLETVEILNNPETMKHVLASREDIKLGRVEEVTSVWDMLNEA